MFDRSDNRPEPTDFQNPQTDEVAPGVILAAVIAAFLVIGIVVYSIVSIGPPPQANVQSPPETTGRSVPAPALPVIGRRPIPVQYLQQDRSKSRAFRPFDDGDAIMGARELAIARGRGGGVQRALTATPSRGRDRERVVSPGSLLPARRSWPTCCSMQTRRRPRSRSTRRRHGVQRVPVRRQSCCGARRGTVRDAPCGAVVVMTWGDPNGMEAASLVAALRPLLPTPGSSPSTSSMSTARSSTPTN